MNDIYKYQATKDIIKQEASELWVLEKVEYTDGIQLHIVGCSYPQKGLPTPEALTAINSIKKILKTFNIFIFSTQRFETVCWPIMSSFILKEEYQQAFTKEFSKFFKGKTAEIISHIFEYDWAYRLRIQDLFTASTKEKLMKRPYREVKHLIQLNKERDYKEVSDKFKYVPYLFLIPSLRRSFRASLREIDYEKLCYDEGDRYWALQRIEYDSFGKNFDERKEMLQGYQVAQSIHIE